jgi:hypothetical protein
LPAWSRPRVSDALKKEGADGSADLGPGNSA